VKFAMFPGVQQSSPQFGELVFRNLSPIPLFPSFGEIFKIAVGLAATHLFGTPSIRCAREPFRSSRQPLVNREQRIKLVLEAHASGGKSAPRILDGTSPAEMRPKRKEFVHLFERTRPRHAI